ncbi:MAG TPA: xylulokinase [Pseudonocardiaceae bacterium]|nr:xylulokinase [Pseudonocardiaceae bacterium]
MAGKLVAGIDSSTQSCKVVVRDADTGELVREGRATHPVGTEVAPSAWAQALEVALVQAGGLADVAAVSVAAQQHGMVCLDEYGEVVRPALLWNDTRSAKAADELVAEAGSNGRREWAEAVGSVPLASFTVTKLRWLAEHEPEAAKRTAAVVLPHDWLTWRLAGAKGINSTTTDRSDASGTGYYSPATNSYRHDLLTTALGHDAVLPTVLGPRQRAGTTPEGVVLGVGAGDNAAAALGVALRPGDVLVSIGTSGTVFAVAEQPSADPSGAVAGFADATGRFLPLVCTLNAARVLDTTARLLRVDAEQFSELALQAPPGADGLVLVPYLEGERTPDKPEATGSLHGLTMRTMSAAHLARAAVEGMLCGLADGLDALVAQGVRVGRVLLVGGGARSEAVARIAPSIFGRPVVIPPPGEYVADGAARQAAWALSGQPEPPQWSAARYATHKTDLGQRPESIRERYAQARDQVLNRLVTGP